MSILSKLRSGWVLGKLHFRRKLFFVDLSCRVERQLPAIPQVFRQLAGFQTLLVQVAGKLGKGGAFNTLSQYQAEADPMPQVRISNRYTGGAHHGWMGNSNVFNLGRADIDAAANDDVFF